MSNRWPVHYGWVVVFTSFLGVVACLGFGRFALGMLLPAMALSLDLSNSQVGLISTANFVGYLLAVLGMGLFTGVSPRARIFSALLLVGLSMAAISAAHGFLTITILYFVTGMGSGLANVSLMALVLAWFVRRKSGRASGFVVCGSGLAILLSGQLIPFVHELYGLEGWRINWLILGGMVIFIALLNLLLIRNRPVDLGLKPWGWQEGNIAEGGGVTDRHDTPLSRPTIFHLGGIYFLFGFTYVIYATFLVTTLVMEMGFSEERAGELWSWVGVLSLLSGPVFGSLSDWIGRKTTLALVFAIQALSYFLLGTQEHDWLFLSIALYGLVAWSIPSIMAAAVGDYVGPVRSAAVFGFITFIFGLGQIAGPALAGIMADMSGSFTGSFFMAAALAATAVAASLLLPPPRGVS